MNIAPPIFVVEDFDITGFRNAESAIRKLEAIDVRSGRLVAFDSTGRRLQLTSDGRDVFFAATGQAPEPDGLKRLLEDFLGNNASGDDLADLVRRFVDRAGLE